MTRMPTGWSGKTLMWLLICLVAIATLDDFWSIAMASPSRELLVVADDDDTDASAERMPACASGSVGHTHLRSFARKTTDVTGLADPRNGFRPRYGPRGPPADGWDERGRTKSPCVWPTAADSLIVAPLPVAATSHHTTLEAKTPAAFSPDRTSGVNKLSAMDALV
jgi:hypothetical protein